MDNPNLSMERNPNYTAQAEELKRNNQPFLTLTKSHMTEMVKINNICIKGMEYNNSDMIEEAIAQSTVFYKDLYENCGLKLDNEMYVAMACYTCFNVEHIPENKNLCDKMLLKYIQEKKEEDNEIKAYSQMINKGKEDNI